MKAPSNRMRGRPRSFHDSSKATHIRSLERAIGILQVISVNEGMTLTEISEDIELAASTVYRMLITMKKFGMVEFSETAQLWSIGAESFRIGNAFLRQTNIVEQSLPVMKQLMLKTDETVNLAVIDNQDIVFIRQVETHQPIRAFFQPGTRGPAYASGIGKALLAFMPEEQFEQLLKTYELKPFTENTITDKNELREEVSAIRERRWSIDDEEHTIGMRCVASPIFNANMEAFAGISISGPTVRVTKEKVPTLGKLIAEAAQQINQSIIGKR